MLLPTINLDMHKESPDQVKKNYFQILIHEAKSFFQVFFLNVIGCFLVLPLEPMKYDVFTKCLM